MTSSSPATTSTFSMATMPQAPRPATTSCGLAAAVTISLAATALIPAEGAGVDYYYGGAGTDWFYLHTDIASGESDYLLDFQAGVDFVLLPFIASGNVTFGVSGAYAYGYIPLAGGTSYIFLAAGATAAQLQAATLFT